MRGGALPRLLDQALEVEPQYNSLERSMRKQTYNQVRAAERTFKIADQARVCGRSNDHAAFSRVITIHGSCKAKRWSGEEGDDAGCGSEKTSGVDPIDQGSAVGTDAQQLQRGGERTDRAALDAIRKRGCRETTSRGRGVQGTGLCRFSPDGQERDSGEARRRRGGVGAAAGAGRWCGRGRRGGGCGQTVTHVVTVERARGEGAAQRDGIGVRNRGSGKVGAGRTRGEHLGVGAGDARGGASGISKWGGESTRWQRGGGTGHGRREESREVAGVGWDGTGQAAHGEREQQRRGGQDGMRAPSRGSGEAGSDGRGGADAAGGAGVGDAGAGIGEGQMALAGMEWEGEKEAMGSHNRGPSLRPRSPRIKNTTSKKVHRPPSYQSETKRWLNEGEDGAGWGETI
ncbi:hypothetical protein DFH08DRAFT_825298 [Mycena albidolilacea]|uniref:Uncharacterized protein n=1 Tax=Mycena albidolilacea TaxID=1033008 RepID=A0AAD7EA98_9AGAR|nr:hypothetical protein DFH08DRAFT_825298 [Mycena albidolilacea]